MRQRRKQSRQGFSIIEMMMVVGIVGILGAAALPQVTQQVTSARLDRSVANVMGYLRQAREDAAYQKVELEIYSATHGQFVYKRGDYDHNGVFETAEWNVRFFNDEPGVVWTMTGGWAAFSPRGTFSGAGTSWELRAALPDGRQWYVYVLPSGQIIQSKTQIAAASP